MERRLTGLRTLAAGIAIAAVLPLGACSGGSVEERAREAAERMKDALGPDVEALAIGQPIDPEAAKEVQRNLTAIHEYQGEINGKLDSVTVNALQAFQRSVGLKDDGIVDAKTRQRLSQAAAAIPAAPAQAAGTN